MKGLKESLKIKNLELKNRLVMPPMATSSTPDGYVNQKLLDYYGEKSQGGYIGLIITEHSYVNRQGMAGPGQLSCSRDSDIEGLSRLAQTIHRNGTKAIAQISHAGSAASMKMTGMKTISASAVLNEGATSRNGELPDAMSLAQIDKVIEDFVLAAVRVKKAGFDGVEIHSAHGYLLNQFYSPLTNKRTDEYTGSTLEGRLRLHSQIIKAVREEAGEDYIIALRLGGSDYIQGGTTIEDSEKAAILLEKYGVDILDISGGMNGYTIAGNHDEGYFSEMSARIKRKVAIPVILTGGIRNAETAERLLKEEKADLIGVGRTLLRDPDWARRAMVK